MNKKAYLLIHHTKGFDFASGYGDEKIQGVAVTLADAKKWVKEYKETNFNRRLYEEINVYK